MADSRFCSLSFICFCSWFFSIGPKRLEKWFTHISPFWMGSPSCFGLLSLFQFSQKLFVCMESSISCSWFLTCWTLFSLTVFLYCFSVSPYWRRVIWLSGSLCFWFERFLIFFLRFLQSLSYHLSFSIFSLAFLFDTFRFARVAVSSNILLRPSTALFIPSLFSWKFFF